MFFLESPVPRNGLFVFNFPCLRQNAQKPFHHISRMTYVSPLSLLPRGICKLQKALLSILFFLLLERFPAIMVALLCLVEIFGNSHLTD